MSIPEFNDIIEPNDQTEARREHLDKLRAIVGNVYPNKFERTKISGDEDTISNLLKYKPVAEIVEEFEIHKSKLNEGEKPDQELKSQLNEKLKALGTVRVSGRIAVPLRVMGKAAFVHLSDGKNRLQVYCRKGEFILINNSTSDKLEEPTECWKAFSLFDHGDFIGVEGFLFLTNTGELSVHVEKIQFLAKALLPMPDKMHGIADAEIARRYRYADLIASSLRIKTEEEIEEEKRTGIIPLTTREVFERRAKLISGMRRFLDDHGYIEVETPMLTPKATGAAAEPFKTHHKALDIDLYARIAPELYLKRLTVGGFEKVYELNRNFRNEGLSMKHNPEFTMLEFYCAYMDVNGMMDFAEAMIKESVQKATGGSLVVNYDGKEIDFSKSFARLPMKETVIEELKRILPSFQSEWLDDLEKARHLALFAVNYYNQDENSSRKSPEELWENAQNFDLSSIKNTNPETNVLENVLVTLFELLLEENLINPTFIIDYPKSISPLSKASPENPDIAERFELFINGMEVANGFSELNDPVEQFERFVDQQRERESGDVEAMVFDEDYIRALSYGMPPAAGIGIGIDRLVMLLTNKHSIRDVILFPHMRPIHKEEEKETRIEPVNPS